MIRGLLRLAATAFVYFCVATVLAEGIALTLLRTSGALTGEAVFQHLAVAYNIDLKAIEADSLADEQMPGNENVALAQIIKARAMKSLDLDLREQSLQNGLDDLRNLQTQLAKERDRYDRVKSSFGLELEKLEDNATNSAVAELQRTIEAIDPKQAKAQILIMIEDDAMSTVVKVMKAMPLDKRKKLIAQFKTDEEITKLADILRQIRLANPEVPLIEKTRDQLRQFSPENS